jgi:hypothetical protein
MRSGNSLLKAASGTYENTDLFHAEDPTRPVTVGCDNIAADDNPAKAEFLSFLI